MLLLIGLGANLGDRHGALQWAAGRMAERFRWRIGSQIFATAALGPRQADFLNAAALVEADDHPLRVLAFCQLLESEAGRDRRREKRWGPRLLDLDLLLAEGLVLASPALSLPHPRLHLRRFALAPAAQLVPHWLHPRVHRTMASLAGDPALADQACEPTAGSLTPPFP